jgi:hypothetical protein
MPFCIQDFIICDDAKKQAYKITGNHQSEAIVHFENPAHTTSLTFHFKSVYEDVPVSVFGVRC